MPLEPLDSFFEEVIEESILVQISHGDVVITNMTDANNVRISEDDLGKLMDKWMLARLAMNKRKTEGRYEKFD